MQIQSEKQPQNILFIGAGGSFGARFEPPFPPLGKNLLNFLQENLGNIKIKCRTSRFFECCHILEKAEEIIATAQQKDANFEQFLSMLKTEERQIIHRTIQIAFSDLSSCGVNIDLGFTSQADRYDLLIDRLNLSRENWCIISLNYDLLFEEALNRKKIDYYYAYVPVVNSRNTKSSVEIRIFKPHGSINFFALNDFKISFGNKYSEPGLSSDFKYSPSDEIQMQYPIVFADAGSAENVLQNAICETTFPVIANYTKGKVADNNYVTLDKIRNEALSIASTARKIVIVGVNPKVSEDDDNFVFKLLRYKFDEVEFVCSNDTDLKLLLRLHPKAAIFSKGLEAYVNFDSSEKSDNLHS